MNENALMKFFLACLSGSLAGLWWEVDKPWLAVAWFVVAAIWVLNGVETVRADRLVKRQRQEWGIDR